MLWPWPLTSKIEAFIRVPKCNNAESLVRYFWRYCVNYVWDAHTRRLMNSLMSIMPPAAFFFFWYSAIHNSRSMTIDSHHLAGGSQRRRTAATAARHPWSSRRWPAAGDSWRRRTAATVERHLQSSHRWESCLCITQRQNHTLANYRITAILFPQNFTTNFTTKRKTVNGKDNNLINNEQNESHYIHQN